ncbi:hypothetical protein [Aureimonas sp. ME7]|uniref:hypothetical protein n=1 Tax=Aureimonas sp. ME7 TaxID=2744252 RepID=UPI0015FD31DA|nr:hypothetical protein [Aureimonas sp. ME7]
MATDDLFFLRTGEESRPFVLVRLIGGRGKLRGSASISGPTAGQAPADEINLNGDLPDVLRDAQEHAMLHGLDLRIALDGNEWPEELGIIGNVERPGDQRWPS